MNGLQQNLMIVLERTKSLVQSDEDFADDFAMELEGYFNAIAMDDGFGTERQGDPRGDAREGAWSIFGKVQKLKENANGIPAEDIKLIVAAAKLEASSQFEEFTAKNAAVKAKFEELTNYND